MNFEDFLQEIVAFINEATGEKRNDVLQQSAEKIITYYVREKKEGLYDRMEEALGNDLELYYLVLSTIHFIAKDAACVAEMENLLLSPDLDLFVACDVWFQLANVRFRDASLPRSYVRSRQINRFLLERYEKEYPLKVPFLPYKERNKKRIIIETDILLNDLHAPTRIILDACQTLIRDLGYEVLLLVNVESTDLDWMNRFYLFPYVTNYRKEIMGRFSISYEDINVQGYQLYWKKETIPELHQLLQELYEWKPLCIWHIGAASFCHDIYRKMTTVISMPCTEGYIVSEAPVLVSYMQSGSLEVKEAISYIEQNNQKMLNIKPATKHIEVQKEYKKSDFGMPEDAFVICIAGNRLDDEISAEFEEMIEGAAAQSDRIYMVVIGNCNKRFFRNIEKERVKYLGFRKDLVDVINVTDLLVNPPRKGGGGSAIRAFSLGIPVVTLPYCDVASVTGEEFQCEDLPAMQELIHRYEADDVFYKGQQEKAKEKYEQRLSVSSMENYKNMLQQLEEWLEKGEVS